MKYLIKILAIDKMNEYEGAVQFEINDMIYGAFFYREEFKAGQCVEVEFDHLEYPLAWNVIFNENKDKELKLKKSKESDWSYYGYGKIISVDPVIADFSDIQLELGNWTNDPRVIGEFIYWKIERLDIITTNK